MGYKHKIKFSTEPHICDFCTKEINVGDEIFNFKNKIENKMDFFCSGECKSKFAHVRFRLKKFYETQDQKRNDNSDDYVECKICGGLFNSLQSHLPHKHSMSVPDYKIKFNLTDDDCFSKSYIDKLKEIANDPEIMAKRSQSLESFILRYGEELGKERYDEFCRKSGYGATIDYYIETFGEELETEKYNNKIEKLKLSNTLNGLIETHGEDVGKEIWKKRCSDMSFTISLDGFKHRHGEELGLIKFNKCQKLKLKNRTLNGFIESHGEEKGTELYNLMCDSHKLNIDWCISKFGEEAGTIEYDRRRAVNKFSKSLDGYIDRHGEVEGFIKWSEMVNNKLQKLKINYSKIASDLFNNIYNILDEEAKKSCMYQPFTKEFVIKNNESGSVYMVDFKLNNKIIEFNGDYFHTNPNIYPPTFYNKTKKKTALQIWDYDKIKSDYIKSLGYELLIIWEDDYKKNKQDIIQKCVNFILGDSK